MLCTRCAREKTLSETELVTIREHGGPPLPAGICIRCLLEDPELRAELDRWSDERIKTLIDQARTLAARSLEAIDRFVESFR